MPGGRVNGANAGPRRLWSFAGCVFDEANWTLMVDGRRVAVETKPLELLRELLLNGGNLVPKDQLMDTIWPDVEVVEASLPTAVGKLRRALGDDRRDRPIIETVQRLGYRLAVPVEVEQFPNRSNATMPAVAAGLEAIGIQRSPRTGLATAAVLAVAAVVVALMLGLAGVAPTNRSEASPRTYTKTDVFTALRRVDVETIERMLAAGWDPNASLDTDYSGALGVLLNNCEWDRGHDRRKMLLAARTLVDGGARIDYRNTWGDTPYSIAKADRYCGPDHPVTQMFHIMCYEGGSPIGDRCLADYKRDSSGKVLRQPYQPAK